MDASYIELKMHPAKGAHLVAIEAVREVPFPIARTYYLFGGDPLTVHGRHAHRRGRLLVVCLRGECRVRLDDGQTSEEFFLDRPDRGLLLGPLLWEEYWLSSEAILLVLCDTPHDPDDQITDYQEFLALAASPGERSPIPFLGSQARQRPFQHRADRRHDQSDGTGLLCQRT